MKPIVLLFILFFLYNESEAQISKGNWLFGGSATYSSEKSKFSDGTPYIQRTVLITPNAGYFFKDKFAGGLKTSFRSYTTIYEVDDLNNVDYHLTAGPFVRYYFLENGSRFNFLVQGNYEWGTFTHKDGYYPNLTHTDPTSLWGLLGGPVLFLNTSVAVELLTGYSSYELGDNPERKTFQILIGLQFHLEKE